MTGEMMLSKILNKVTEVPSVYLWEEGDWLGQNTARISFALFFIARTLVALEHLKGKVLKNKSQGREDMNKLSIIQEANWITVY